MPIDKQYNKVFVSYAKEDIDEANKIYNYLVDNGYEPWVDKKKLLPGQDWDYEIKRALKEADFIILLLSDISVEKRGYVQREYRLALQYYEEKLDSDIYIIPCKINNCQVPDKLSKYQWVEMYKSEDSLGSILQSLDFQRQKYINVDKQIKLKNTSLEYEEAIIKKTIDDRLPKCKVDITYPQFIDKKNEDLFFLNSLYQHEALSKYNGFIYSSSLDLFQEVDNNNNKDEVLDIYSLDDEIQSNYNFQFLSKNIISITVFTHLYQSGAAHGMYGTIGYNYRLNPLIEITIEKLFDWRTEILEYLYITCKQRLIKDGIDKEIVQKEDDSFLFEELYLQEWDTFNNFYLNQDSLVIIFNPYTVSTYAFGDSFIMIEFDEILNLYPDLITLSKIKSLLQ